MGFGDTFPTGGHNKEEHNTSPSGQHEPGSSHSISDKEVKEKIEATAKIIMNSEFTWESAGKQMRDIAKPEYSGGLFNEEEFYADYCAPLNLYVALFTDDKERIDGFTYGKPVGDGKGFEISFTGIKEEYRHKGLVAKLMDKLENELRDRGYEYFERDAEIRNGYADKIKKVYADRIVEDESYGGSWHFRIKL